MADIVVDVNFSQKLALPYGSNTAGHLKAILDDLGHSAGTISQDSNSATGKFSCGAQSSLLSELLNGYTPLRLRLGQFLSTIFAATAYLNLCLISARSCTTLRSFGRVEMRNSKERKLPSSGDVLL